MSDKRSLTRWDLGPREISQRSLFRGLFRGVLILLIVASFSISSQIVAASGGSSAGSGSGSNQSGNSGAQSGSFGSQTGQESPSYSPPVTTLAVQTGPEFATNDSANGFVYVPNEGTTNPGTVSVFTSGTTATTVDVGNNPLRATYDALNGYVYVTNKGSASVTPIAGTTPETPIIVGSDPWFAAYDPQDGYVYVPNYGITGGSGTTVTILSNLSKIATVTVPKGPQSAVYDAATHSVFVSDKLAGEISIIKGTSLVKSINLNSTHLTPQPLVGAYDTANHDVYIPESGNGTVAVVNGTGLVREIAVGPNPHSATYNAYFGFIDIAVYGTNSVAVINATSSGVKSMMVGSLPLFGAVDESDGIYFVVDSGGSNATAILGMRFNDGNFSTGLGPQSATYDTGDGNIWIPNFGTGANSVSVIEVRSTKMAPCASLQGLTAQVQDGFKQAWVNWTDPIRSRTSLIWYVLPEGSGGAALSTPPQLNNSSYHYSMNLNDLTSATIYYFYIHITDSCSSGSGVAGNIKTSAAPVTGFEGLVSKQRYEPYLLDPVGHPIAGATVYLEAACPDSGGPQYLDFAGGGSLGSGWYSEGFPLYQTGAGGLSYELESNGECWGDGAGGGFDYQTNSQYTMIASHNGEWNITRLVSSTLSPSNDYQQFTLPPNNVVNEPIALAFIHTVYNGTNYSNAECGTQFTVGTTKSTESQTFAALSTQYFGLSGSSTTTVTNTSGSGWSAPALWGISTGLMLGYNFTGFASDSSLNTPENSYIASNHVRGAIQAPFTYKDWSMGPGAYTGTVPAGYGYDAVPPTYNSSSKNISPSYSIFAGGTFTQATQAEAKLTIPIEWEGINGSLSYSSTVKTSITTSLSWTEGCGFFNPIHHAPNPNLYALFLYFKEDTGAPSTFVHVWFEGWCERVAHEGAYHCPGY
jgi:DNA-binding beta-propeller fold protein YncE